MQFSAPLPAEVLQPGGGRIAGARALAMLAPLCSALRHETRALCHETSALLRIPGC